MARLYGFWYEQNGSNDLWSVRVGLMLADSQFLQSKTAANFINNGISWPDFLAANLPASGPAFPLPAPGVRVRLKPRDDMQFQAAVFSGDPSGGNGSNQPVPLPTGTVFSFSGGAFFIAEASYLPNQGKDARGLPGAYRVGALVSHQRAFRRSALRRYRSLGGKSAIDRHSDGACRRWRRLWRDRSDALSRPGTADQGLSGFVRAGGVPQDRNLINFYADGGLLYKGLVPHRSDDKIGIAAAYSRVGDNARGLDADIGLFSGNASFRCRAAKR